MLLRILAWQGRHACLHLVEQQVAALKPTTGSCCLLRRQTTNASALYHTSLSTGPTCDRTSAKLPCSSESKAASSGASAMTAAMRCSCVSPPASRFRRSTVGAASTPFATASAYTHHCQVFVSMYCHGFISAALPRGCGYSVALCLSACQYCIAMCSDCTSLPCGW